MVQNPVKIAILMIPTLGDTLLYLVLANNLQINDYQVTLFSTPFSHLKKWLPNVLLKPLPVGEDIRKVFSGYDLVISIPPIVDLYKNTVPADEFANFCVFIYVGKNEFRYKVNVNHTDRLKKIINDPNKLQKILPLLRASDVTFSDISRTLPLAETMKIFCKTILKLDNVSKEIEISPPEELMHRKYSERIIIHPTSSKNEKNWVPMKFVKLARLLRQQGWDPVFVMSPPERAAWQKLINNEFLLPIFPTLDELAAFVYESGLMIGNDSGVGHLASCLNIPTLTIMNTNPGSSMRWRPGWAYGELVYPTISLNVLNRRYWKCFLSVKKVFNEFNRFVENLRQRNLL
jgi:heptosyltransferase-3